MNPSPPRSLPEAGSAYIALGFRVVPIAGKRPLGEHGYASATGDLCELLARLPRPGTTGIGIQAGPNVLVDVDHRDALEWLCGLIGGKPETLTARSGSGGLHFYFGNADGLALSYRLDRFPAGFEVKLGNGSGLVAPPSVHPETGRRYTWLHWEEPTPCPDALLELLEPPAIERQAWTPSATSHNGSTRYGAAALRRHAERVAAAEVGSRRHTLNGAAFACGQLAGSGHLDPGRIADELERAALATGLPAREIRATVERGLRDGAARPFYPAGRAA